MKKVDLKEADLLTVARALVTPDSFLSVESTLQRAIPVNRLGPTAMGVLEDLLSKGIVRTLARLGGARLRSRPGGVGRVFDLREVPELAFSSYTFELLRYLTSKPLYQNDTPPFEQEPETLGDALCAYLTLKLVEGSRLERVLVRWKGLHTPLTWLGFVRPIARNDEKSEAPSLSHLLAHESSRTVVECLSLDLTRRWLASTSWDEYDILAPDLAVRIGTQERAVLDGFLDAVEKVDRWDLATFLIDAGVRVLHPKTPAKDIAARAAPPVRQEGPLRARSEARRRAGAMFQALTRLAKKRDELALVRFIDDGYDVAQAMLTSWEVLPREAFLKAENVIVALDSLDGVAPTPTTPEATA